MAKEKLKKKLLWRGTLGELRKHYLYNLIKEDVLAEVDKLLDKHSEFVYGYYEGDKHINSLGFKKLKEDLGINQDASGRLDAK